MSVSQPDSSRTSNDLLHDLIAKHSRAEGTIRPLRSPRKTCRTSKMRRQSVLSWVHLSPGRCSS